MAEPSKGGRDGDQPPRDDKRKSGQSDKRMSGQSDKRMSGQSDKRMSGQSDKRMSGQSDKRMSGGSEHSGVSSGNTSFRTAPEPGHEEGHIMSL